MEISAQTKQSNQKHCHAREASLQCAIFLVVFVAHLSMDIVEQLPRNAGSRDVPGEQI
jgi:hypothetical protein